MGKVPWGSMLGAMLASMLGSSCQHMGEATIGKIPVGFHIGVPVSFQWTGCCRPTFPCWLEVLGPLRLR